MVPTLKHARDICFIGLDRFIVYLTLIYGSKFISMVKAFGLIYGVFLYQVR